MRNRCTGNQTTGYFFLSPQNRKTVKYNIGIDIGTTNLKVLALDLQGKRIALEKASYPIISEQPGFKEQDPEAIFSACIQSLQKLLQKMDEPPQAIGFSCAMHSLIAIDKAGKALTRAILWADTRSEVFAQELRHTAAGDQIYLGTGTPIHPISPLLKIRWLKENAPAIFQNTRLFTDIKSYILNRLFGKWWMDYSIASATGLMNLKKKEWFSASLQYAGIEAGQLPELVDTHF